MRLIFIQNTVTNKLGYLLSSPIAYKKQYVGWHKRGRDISNRTVTWDGMIDRLTWRKKWEKPWHPVVTSVVLTLNSQGQYQTMLGAFCLRRQESILHILPSKLKLFVSMSLFSFVLLVCYFLFYILHMSESYFLCPFQFDLFPLA